MSRSLAPWSRRSVLAGLALVLLMPIPGDAADPVDADALVFELVGVNSDFGPETYKTDGGFNTRNAENHTANWGNALGHRISFLVRVDGGDATLTCEDRFVAEAYVDDPVSGRVWGWTNGTFRTEAPSGVQDVCVTGLPGVRIYNVTFDLDGAPPSVRPGVTYPALSPSSHIAKLDLYYSDDPSPSNPTGTGPLAGSFDIAFAIAPPDLALDEPFQRFPESSLRLFSDVGSAPDFPDAFQMLPRVLTASDVTNLTITFTGTPVGATFQRIDHYATRTGAGLETPVDAPPEVPPLEPVQDRIDNIDDRATVEVERIDMELSNDTVPPSRQVVMTVRGSDFGSIPSPTVGPYVPLHVVSVHVPATLETMTTGVGTFLAAVSDNTFPVRGFVVNTGVGGVTGSTELTLQDPTRVSGGATGSNAGDLFALQEIGSGHDVIAKARLARQGDLIRGSLSHREFDAVPSYTMLALLYGPSDEFLGMTTLRRGIDIQVGALRTVEGRTETIPLTITNLGTDFDGVPGEAVFSVVVRISSDATFPDGSAYNHTTGQLNEGGSVTLAVPVPAARPGDFNIAFAATTGELTDTADSTVTVISKERHREENRKWYEIPGPPALLLVALALVAAARARRRTSAPDRAP